MIGFAVGVGCFVHLMGDIITRAGVPILWPIPTGKRMWRMIGLPDAISIEAGSKIETQVLSVAFTLISLAAGAGLLSPALLESSTSKLLAQVRTTIARRATSRSA